MLSAHLLFGHRFGPKLIAVAQDCLDVDARDFEREKFSRLPVGAHIFFFVGRAEIHRRARGVDHRAAIRRTRAVGLAG